MIRAALKAARPNNMAETRQKFRIAAKVANATGVKLSEMRGIRRDNETVAARWAAMHAMRAAGHSYPSIGKFFNRDHTTVMHAINRMEAATCQAQ